MVLHRGTRCFRKHAGFVHWLGYTSMLLAWGISYALVTTLLPVDGMLLLGLGMLIATICSGVVSGFLYSRAIGSPIGNVLASFVLVVLMPPFVFERLVFRGSVTMVSESLGYFVIIGPIALAGMLTTIKTLGYGYSRMTDPLVWEREVMPLGVRVFDPEPSPKRGKIAPRIEEEQDRTMHLRIGCGVKAMAVSLTLLTAALYVTIRYAPPEQAGGPILLALVYVLARAYTYDE